MPKLQRQWLAASKVVILHTLHCTHDRNTRLEVCHAQCYVLPGSFKKSNWLSHTILWLWSHSSYISYSFDIFCLVVNFHFYLVVCYFLAMLMDVLQPGKVDGELDWAQLLTAHGITSHSSGHQQHPPNYTMSSNSKIFWWV